MQATGEEAMMSGGLAAVRGFRMREGRAGGGSRREDAELSQGAITGVRRRVWRGGEGEGENVVHGRVPGDKMNIKDKVGWLCFGKKGGARPTMPAACLFALGGGLEEKGGVWRLCHNV